MEHTEYEALIVLKFGGIHTVIYEWRAPLILLHIPQQMHAILPPNFPETVPSTTTKFNNAGCHHYVPYSASWIWWLAGSNFSSHPQWGRHGRGFASHAHKTHRVVEMLVVFDEISHLKCIVVPFDGSVPICVRWYPLAVKYNDRDLMLFELQVVVKSLQVFRV